VRAAARCGLVFLSIIASVCNGRALAWENSNFGFRNILGRVEKGSDGISIHLRNCINKSSLVMLRWSSKYIINASDQEEMNIIFIFRLLHVSECLFPDDTYHSNPIFVGFGEKNLLGKEQFQAQRCSREVSH